MNELVNIPLWLLVVMVVCAAVAVLDHLLVPSVRWFFRRRVKRVLEEVTQHLNIRLEPFKLTKREVLIDRLLYDAQVLEAAQEHAAEHGLPRDVVMARVERYAREIVPAFNPYFYFRIGTWLARRAAQLLYRVRLGFVDEHGLETIDPKATVVFVMNHRSNMDYVLVGYLAASRAALSYAVGEWAKVWPLQSLIRSMGAFFVRRHSRNALYRRVLARYVHMATVGGVTQALFPEGGLSRDGALCPPKKGLLKYLIHAFDPEQERDLVFVPVGLNYDRVLEDRSLLLELAPDKGTPSLLAAVGTTLRFVARNLAQMVIGRWHRFGYAYVNFASPLSLRAYCAEHMLRPSTLDDEQLSPVVDGIAELLMRMLGEVIPVVPVALVARVFYHADAPLTPLELKARAQQLITTLENRGVPVHIPRQSREYAIEVGLRMLTLRHVVCERDGMLTISEGELPLLAYYANSVSHFFDRR